MSIFEKLFEIMAEADTLPRSAHNEELNFDFIPDNVVDEFVRKKLVEKRLLLFFNTDVLDSPVNNRSKVVISYRFTDIDSGEEAHGTWVGEGWSPSGFGTSIAITSGIKQLIIKNFHIPSGDVSEAPAETSAPSIVEKERIAEVAIPIPGEKRTRRSAKKAVTAVAEKMVAPEEQPAVDAPPINQPDPALIPDDETETPPPNGDIFSSTEYGIPENPIAKEDEKPVNVTSMILVASEQMKAGIAANVVKEISKGDVTCLAPDVQVYYSFFENDGTKKIVYAITQAT